MFNFIKEKFKPHHFHFLHGWAWGVIIVSAVGLLVIGVRGHYFQYWFGSDYKIVNTHEVVQSQADADKLADVMRSLGIQKTVLVAAPNQVIFFDGGSGFTGYDHSNDVVLQAQAARPSRFIAFCTVNLSKQGYMEEVADCVSRGAQGFKLYSGHSFFHDKALNDPLMFAFYDYAQTQKLPVIFHVNSAKFQDEFEAVLKLYPDMKVICPHFCLTSNNLQRLSYLLDTYPNLYADLSFGNEQYLKEGLERVSGEPAKYREFIERYADRFFYGTDIIVTDYEGKDREWLKKLFRIYRDVLEKETFTTFLTDDTEWKGLNLSPDILKKIYETNWKKFLAE